MTDKPERQVWNTGMDTEDKKKKRTGRLRKIGLIGMFVFGAVIVLGVVLYVCSERAYAQGEASYEELHEQIQALEAETGAGQPSDADDEGSNEMTTGEQSADSAFIDSLALLTEINLDFRAWIVQEGTCIDYPIVLGEDNEYYLKHLFTGEKNKLGCLFMDCRNTGDFSDRITVIYGHNMQNGSMFHGITDYEDPEVFELRPTMTIYTLDKAYTLELVTGIVVSGDDEFIEFEFESEDDFMVYIEKLKEMSTFKSSTEVQPEDRLVMLCTCSHEYNNARYVLVGRLVEMS